MPVVDASVVVDVLAPDVPSTAPARTLFAKWLADGAALFAPGLLWLAIVWALVIGLIGGLAPSIRAANLPVATALRAT